VEFCGAYSWKLEGLFWTLKVKQNAVYRYLASLVKPFFGAEINLTVAISPGATPSQLVLALGKDGKAYLIYSGGGADEMMLGTRKWNTGIVARGRISTVS
jgi:hypothetical protein